MMGEINSSRNVSNDSYEYVKVRGEREPAGMSTRGGMHVRVAQVSWSDTRWREHKRPLRLAETAENMKSCL